MITPNYKKLKKNGSTLYVFPSVEEDKNFENQNDNFKMYLSHYALVKFPRQIKEEVLDFDDTFKQNGSSLTPTKFKDQLVESLRNYVANQESTIKNSKINTNEFYYDTFELENNTEKIFWKWCKKLGVIDFEFADNNSDYFGADSKYDDNGPVGNTDHFRKHLLKERSNIHYTVEDIPTTLINNTIPNPLPVPSTSPIQMKFVQITLSGTTRLEPGDYVLLSIGGIDNTIDGYSDDESLLKVVGLATTTTINDTIIVEIDNLVNVDNDFGTDVTDLEIYNSYDRFLQFICEVNGVNNVQMPNRAYTESQSYISNQHGQTPYSLWDIKQTNNYKPNSKWPILPAEIQAEIQGGENVNNPILTNSNLYPGDIWGQFDDAGFLYTTKTGNIVKRYEEYYGVTAINNNEPTVPTLSYPDFDGSTTDGLVLDLNINDYAKAVTYVYPIDSFNEFGSTSFNNEAPEDFEFNAVLWYYTIDDVSGNNMNSATNLYGIEFLDTPENDIEEAKNKIPTISKYVTNGYQDGNSFTFTLDTNLQIESGDSLLEFDAEKVYSLFGMELYYEAMNRLTYFNDKITDLITSNLTMKQQIDELKGMVFNQSTLESIRNRMNNIENLLNVYSTLQIGDTDSIIARLDTSVNPPLVRLTSVDKRYGNIYTYNTKQMYTEFINQNGYTEISINEEIVPDGRGKDFLILINNNDNSIPPDSAIYDPTLFFENLELTLTKDLQYKQSVDILILPFTNIEPISNSNITNFPVNDKKLNININYDYNGNIVKQNIGRYSLPITANYDRPNNIVNNEPVVGLNRSPIWDIKDVFISKINPNERMFSIYVNADLINDLTTKPFIDEFSRIFLQNLLLEKKPQTPSDEFFDLSDQYNIYNSLEFERSNITTLEIVNKGTGYPTGTYTKLFTIPIGPGTSDVNIQYTVGNMGDVTDAQIIDSSLYINQTEIDSNSYIINSGNSDAEIRFIIKPVTKINFVININETPEINLLLTNYDSFINWNIVPKFNINNYLKLLPQLRLLMGYKINITRISNEDIPSTQLDKRYKIKVDMI